MRSSASFDQIEDSGHFLVDRARGDQPECPGDLDLGVRLARFDVGDAEDREARRRRLGLPHRFDRRDLHLLVLGGGVAALIAEHDDRQRRRQAEARRDGERALGEGAIAPAQQVERADRQHEHRAGDVAGADRVHELRLRDRIEDHLR